MKVAVLTGDLIGSTRLGAAKTDAAITALATASNEFSKWATTGPARFTRNRGDGWQIVLERPSAALRAALYLTAALRNADLGLGTRIGIGIGGADKIGTSTLADASGPAFVTSGRLLEQMKHGRRVLIDGEGTTAMHKAVTLLAAERAERWTKEQAEAMMLALTDEMMTLETAAVRLGISKQATSYRLKGAGHSAVMTALDLWEGTWND